MFGIIQLAINSFESNIGILLKWVCITMALMLIATFIFI